VTSSENGIEVNIGLARLDQVGFGAGGSVLADLLLVGVRRWEGAPHEPSWGERSSEREPVPKGPHASLKVAVAPRRAGAIGLAADPSEVDDLTSKGQKDPGPMSGREHASSIRKFGRGRDGQEVDDRVDIVSLILVRRVHHRGGLARRGVRVHSQTTNHPGAVMGASTTLKIQIQSHFDPPIGLIQAHGQPDLDGRLRVRV
jgi:hypothetical protein